MASSSSSAAAAVSSSKLREFLQTASHSEIVQLNNTVWADALVIVYENRSDARTMVTTGRRDSVVLFGTFLCVWSAVLNLALAWVLVRRPPAAVHHRRHQLLTPLRWFLLNFTVCQLLEAALVLPFSILKEFQMSWSFGVHLCRFWLLLQVFLVAMRFWSLFVVTVDRLIYAKQPVAYEERPRRGATVVAGIVVPWLISLLATIPMAVSMRNPEFVLPEVCAISMDVGAVFGTTLAAYLVPAACILAGSAVALSINTHVQKALRRMRAEATGSTSDTSSLVTEYRQSSTGEFLKTAPGGAGCQTLCRSTPTYSTYDDYQDVQASTFPVVAVNLLAVAMWAPFYITNLKIPFCRTMCVDPTLWTLFIWLGYCTTGLAPLLWFLHPEVKSQMKAMLGYTGNATGKQRTATAAHAHQVTCDNRSV